MRLQLPEQIPFSRRSLLRAAGAAAFSGLGATLPPEAHAAPGPRSHPPRDGQPHKTVAAVVTAYFPLSHAYHIVGRFLHGYMKHGQFYSPMTGTTRARWWRRRTRWASG